ncbi:MAG: NADH-quinone oxidoreductase subunit NuoE [Elusimicrobiales bacterium]|jgi:NADH-quinone oxidoreductase subunit E
MSYEISKKTRSKIDELLKSYPRKEAVLIPALREVQNEAGWISEDAMDALSAALELPYARVKGVVTFYTMFNRVPAGRYHLQVCRNISCHFMGAPELLRRLKEKLKITEGETTRDGLFTLSTVECLASCGSAPVIAVNGTYHENMNPEKLDLLLEELRAGK